MKVADLIEQLQGMDPEAEVHLAYGYGDHWRTTVAPKVSQVGEGIVEFSEYHRMDKLIEIDEDYDDEDTGETRTVRHVVVLE